MNAENFSRFLGDGNLPPFSYFYRFEDVVSIPPTFCFLVGMITELRNHTFHTSM
jgi:hypothetical protein